MSRNHGSRKLHCLLRRSVLDVRPGTFGSQILTSTVPQFRMGEIRVLANILRVKLSACERSRIQSIFLGAQLTNIFETFL